MLAVLVSRHTVFHLVLHTISGAASPLVKQCPQTGVSGQVQKYSAFGTRPFSILM